MLLDHSVAPYSAAERVQGVMRQVYDEVRAGLYTLDHDMDLIPAVVSPGSDLARIPYFALAQTLAQARTHLWCLLARRIACSPPFQCGATIQRLLHV